MVFYERRLLKEIRKWADKKTIVVLTGMRQVGKTTLLKKVFDETPSKNKVFLDLENPINQRIFKELDYDNVWANLRTHGVVNSEKAYLFLDELQAVPEAVKAVKYLFDNYDVQFFITGSSSFYLKNLFPESLAGRKTVLEMHPLDFEEFLLFRGTPREFYAEFREMDERKNRVSHERSIKLYEEFLAYGGFPRVVLSETPEEKNAVLDDIFKSYFEKDVRSLADFREVSKLQELILLLMQRTGSKLSITRLASELGVSRDTVYSYLSFLEATYFASFVRPFSRSVDREIGGARKVYLCDTGVLNRFSRVSSGAVFENAVFNELEKRGGGMRYYRSRSGTEVDFILKDSGVALEAKETGTPQDARRLGKIAETLKMRESFVVSKTFVDEPGFISATDL